MKRNKNFTIILATALVLVGLIIIVVVTGLCLPEQVETIQGIAETTDYRLSSKVPARVLEICVKEGDRVHKGDTLVVLEAPDIQAKLSQAEAAFSAAQAIEQKAQNGARSEEIQQAYEMWQKAKAGMEVAEKSYRRINRLFEQGVMAEQKRDECKAQYEAMVATEKRLMPSMTWLSMVLAARTKWLPKRRKSGRREPSTKSRPTSMRR